MSAFLLAVVMATVVLATLPALPGSTLGQGGYINGRSIKWCLHILPGYIKALKRLANCNLNVHSLNILCSKYNIT